MANENGNKIKLLVLWDILCKNTDENYAMNAEVPFAEYTKQEFDKYLNSIVYKP